MNVYCKSWVPTEDHFCSKRAILSTERQRLAIPLYAQVVRIPFITKLMSSEAGGSTDVCTAFVKDLMEHEPKSPQECESVGVFRDRAAYGLNTCKRSEGKRSGESH